MAMRLRLRDDAWVAVCAAEHPAEDGDVYLDDAQDHAVREKLWADWDSEVGMDSLVELCHDERSSDELVGNVLRSRLGRRPAVNEGDGA